MVYQKPEALSNLQKWGELSDDELTKLLSWSGLPAGNAQVLFRGKTVPAKAMRHAILRGCPACLTEDIGGEGNPLKHLTIRGDWQFREQLTCIQHSSHLVPLWDIEDRRTRYDYGTNFRSVLLSLQNGSLSTSTREVTGYDRWLDRRLMTGTYKTFFKDKPLNASSVFCRLLGSSLFPDDLDHAHGSGFAVAYMGQRAINSALDGLVARASRAVDEPQVAYGRLYRALSSDLRSDASLDPFREVLRDHVLENWPIAPGRKLLGVEINERRLHSVKSFAASCGIGPALARRVLIEAGAVSRTDERPDSRTLFEARKHASLEVIIPNLVGMTEMRQAINATRTELVSLSDDGVLTKHFPALNQKKSWLIAEGTALIEELGRYALPVSKDAEGWETIQLSHKRRGLSVGDTIAAVREGRLTLGQRDGVVGYHGFCVPMDEGDGLTSRLGIRGPAVIQKIGTPVSSFGRHIGIRDGSNLTALIASGHCQASIPANPAQQRRNPSMSDADIAAFQARFVTITMLTQETGKQRNSIRALLKHAKVREFEDKGVVYRGIYPREQAMAALASDT